MEQGQRDFVNFTELCGNHEWIVWNNATNDFGQCFFSLAIVNPAHALLAIASAYYIGLRSRPYYLRTSQQKWILYTRGLAVLALALSPVICMIASAALHINVVYEEGISYYVEASIEVLAWLLHFIYVMILLGKRPFTLKYPRRKLSTDFFLERITPSIRGKRVALCIFVMVAIVDCLRCKTIITRDINDLTLYTTTKIHAIVRLSCLVLYFLTLIPAGDDSESQYEELLTNERLSERSPLVRSFSSFDYGNFREDTDPNYLGVAKEDSSWSSQFFFYWVNPLIKKGRADLLKNTDDLFDIPGELSTLNNSENYQQMQNDPRNQGSVLRILYKMFVKSFVLIGILKFVADCAGFFAPILLNWVVQFMEDKNEDIRLGYAYAIGLAGSTFIGKFVTRLRDSN